MLCDKIHYRPDKRFHHHQFSMDGMKKLSRISMFIVCWGNNCYLPLSFKWPVTLYHEWLGIFTVFFFKHSSLYVSFERHPNIFGISSVISLFTASRKEKQKNKTKTKRTFFNSIIFFRSIIENIWQFGHKEHYLNLSFFKTVILAEHIFRISQRVAAKIRTKFNSSVLCKFFKFVSQLLHAILRGAYIEIQPFMPKTHFS